MPRSLNNYLRSHRKRLGLTQDEVAFLLGSGSATKVSRYERFRREPTLRIAFAFEVFYHTPARKLFAGIFEDVRRETEKRERRLARRLSKAQEGSEANP